MCSGGIDWTDFSWEAFATIFTGVVAVFGAVWIGLKQTEILKRQTQVQEMTVRADLFERRFENYETVRDFLISLLKVPSEIDGSLQQRFFSAQREAQFLFSPIVASRLSEIWMLCGELYATALDVDRAYTLEGHAGVDLPQQKGELYKRVNSEFLALPDLYREMRLDAPKRG